MIQIVQQQIERGRSPASLGPRRRVAGRYRVRHRTSHVRPHPAASRRRRRQGSSRCRLHRAGYRSWPLPPRSVSSPGRPRNSADTDTASLSSTRSSPRPARTRIVEILSSGNVVVWPFQTTAILAATSSIWMKSSAAPARTRSTPPTTRGGRCRGPLRNGRGSEAGTESVSCCGSGPAVRSGTGAGPGSHRGKCDSRRTAPNRTCVAGSTGSAEPKPTSANR